MRIRFRNHVYDITKKTLVKFAIEAFCGFVLWTLALTPYMIMVTKVTFEQYISWVIMEAVLVPPIAIIVVNATNWIVKKVLDRWFQ